MENRGEIIIYQTEDGQASIEVKMQNETVWLSLDLMASLFQRDKSTITRHIKNIFKEGELQQEAVVANFATTAADGKAYNVDYYNLDVIVSVGYRVKSQRGTQFRIWANRVLKDYLTKGYALNERMRQENLVELRQLVQLVGRTLQQRGDEEPAVDSQGLFDVVVDYTCALSTLDSYDYQRLGMTATTQDAPFHATYDSAMQAILALNERFGESPLFGNEKDESFRSSIGQIYQTFDGVELYPSVEEKAAMLLYRADGSKRITDGDPAGFLRLINCHMPTAAENRLLFIKRTGHTYQQKQQELADKLLALLQDWRKDQLALSIASNRQPSYKNRIRRTARMRF